MRRKWQVFVSSTYSDLIQERQACVEAILRAGHIPAGMELFSAGSESQLEIIMRWIDDSDIYVLILGGRYGSIEPKSGISYTEIEYNYAFLKNKPIVTIILSDLYLDTKVQKDGKKTLELVNGTLLEKFKNTALSRISRMVDNEIEIKLTILESLSDIQNRNDIKGWVKESDLKELSTLINRNQELVERNNSLEKMLRESELDLAKLKNSNYRGASFEKLRSILSSIQCEIDVSYKDIRKALGDNSNILDLFLYFSDTLIIGLDTSYGGGDLWFCIGKVIPKLKIFNLLKVSEGDNPSSSLYQLTELGEQFLSELLIENAQKEF